MQKAHIASGQGDALRTQGDRRGIVLLCPIAHECHVSNSDRDRVRYFGGKEFPTIDARHTLWAKQYWDREYLDIEYLDHFFIRNLPEPEPPPRLWREMLFDNLGVMV